MVNDFVNNIWSIVSVAVGLAMTDDFKGQLYFGDDNHNWM